LRFYHFFGVYVYQYDFERSVGEDLICFQIHFTVYVDVVGFAISNVLI
jgi:hypothetical protein